MTHEMMAALSNAGYITVAEYLAWVQNNKPFKDFQQ